MKDLAKSVFRRLGIEVRRVQPDPPLLDEARVLATWLERLGIDLALDVGANVGQSVTLLRKIGFDGWIFSFEPLPEVFAELAHNMENDRKWVGYNMALGDRDDTRSLFIAANNGQSSSFLKTKGAIEQSHASIFGSPSQISVKISSLDHVLETAPHRGTRVFLKLDAQGYEKHILGGAADTLSRVSLIRTELSFTSVYEGQPEYRDMCSTLENLGFHLVWLTTGFSSPDVGIMYEADAIFARRTDIEDMLNL